MRQVTAAGVVSQDEIDRIETEVVALIDEAVAEAVAAPEPTEAALLTDAYVSY